MKPDLITRALAVVSPKLAMTRMVEQARLREFGRFDAALDSTKRGISRNISGAEDTSATRERYQLIRAARDLADNFSPVRSLLLKFATYVAGRLNYQARTGDHELDEAVERYWAKWCASCDFSRRHGFIELLQLAVMAVLRDGDCGFIIVRDGADLRLQSVEADRIGSPYDRVDTDKYIGGINLDEFGRPISFTIYARTINNQYVTPTDIAASEFVHIFDAMRLDEYRGRSAFASALNATRDLQETIKAEVQAIKWAAYQTGIIYSENGAADPSDYFTRATISDSNQLQRLSSIEPGTVNYLTPGEKMEVFKSERPGGAFQEFVRMVQSHICMAVGLPYGFAYDADKSGPMARLEAAMAERTFARWRGFLERQFLERIKNIVLLDASARGLLPSSEYLLDGRWCWPAKVSIDYGREANADIALWKAGLKTAGQIYSDAGEDYEEALRARAKEAAMIVALADEYDVAPQIVSDSVPMPKANELPVAPAQPEAEPELPEPEINEDTELDTRQNLPNESMATEAKRGLQWRREHGRGGTAVGVARARDIANRKNLSDSTVKRMHSFFSRHAVDKKAKGFRPGEEGFPSAGRIAWALWGGDAGAEWAAAKVKKIASKKLKAVKFEFDAYGQPTSASLVDKTELVMPTPSSGESEEDFVARCMGDDLMISEYPQADQRAAVCYNQSKL